MLEHHDTLDHADETASDLYDTEPQTDAAASDHLADTHDFPEPTDTGEPGGLHMTDQNGQVVELGEPTVSSSGSGEPDTVVTYSDSGAELYTDVDGDGDVDLIVTVGNDGTLTAWATDGNGHWEIAATGTVDPDGEVHWDAADSGSTGDDTTTTTDTTTTDSGDRGDDDSDSGPTVTIPGSDGTEYTGEATYDADGDGVNDTVVVKSDDGSVASATDYDGDGVADQVTVISPDGHVVVSQDNGEGVFEVVATGQVNQDGTIDFDDNTTTTTTTTDDDTTWGDVPSDHIAVPVEGGYADAGEPTYDMDGDGQAETVVFEKDGVLYQFSDIDGDGEADQLLMVDMGSREAAIMVDNGSGWEVASQGHITNEGDFVPENGQQQHQQQQDDHHDDHDGPPNIVVGSGSDAVDIGVPDQDLDGDGVPETVAVESGDGHVALVSDVDHNGTPDQIIDIDTNTGQVTWVVMQDGEWVVVQTGHIDSDGNLHIDDEPSTGGSTAPSDSGVDSAQADLVVTVDGQQFPAGTPTIDSDGDGVADTVAVDGVDGSTQMYQDTDGDGVADRAWTVGQDGSEGAAYVRDDAGQWVPDRA